MVYLRIIPRARVENEMVDSLHAGYNHLKHHPDFILLNKPEEKSKKKRDFRFSHAKGGVHQNCLSHHEQSE